MESLGIALFLTGVISVVHLLGDEINEELFTHLDFITSFSAGITISYVFMMVMPELFNGVSFFGRLEFFLSLAGFSSIYLAKNRLRRKDNVEKIRKDYQELHSIFIIFYYTTIGYLITYLIMRAPVEGFILFIPILLHSAFNSISMRELHEDVLNNAVVKGLIGISPIVGALIAAKIGIPERAFYGLFGIVAGMFFYVALHDSVRPAERGHELGYILGATLYSVFIIVLL